MNKKRIKDYAKLIAKMGINIQKGQEVIIQAELDQPEFVKILVEECYKLGAKKVQVEWNYQPLTKINTKYRTLKTLSSFEDWEIEKLKWKCKTLPAIIYLISEDPDGLKGIDQEKVKKQNANRYPILKPFKDEMENKYQWCIAGVPSIKWAKKIFPTLSKKQAVEKLWEEILRCSHITDNPVQEWVNLNAKLKERCKKLNDNHFKYLKYKSANGTDFKVGLIDEASFLGGSENTLAGVEFNPNIPSEEIFISPKKGVAEGIVYATKPLSYKGELIENFYLKFEEGKVVEVHAERNEELLKKMITMDEGASFLGECALISKHSPINECGFIFYETLYDENASCHLALGAGFSNTINGFEDKTLEECRKLGINESMIHVDFMIGSDDLSIVGIKENGEEVDIFIDGDWAI